MTVTRIGQRAIRDYVVGVYERDGTREEAYTMAWCVLGAKLATLLDTNSLVPLRDELAALVAEVDAANPGKRPGCAVCGDKSGVRCCEFGKDAA